MPSIPPSSVDDLSSGVAAPSLDCVALIASPPRLVPGAADREWMNKTEDKFAYRCTPMTIANASGWDILNPAAFTAEWTGGDETGDVRLTPDHPELPLDRPASVFGHGVLTFHPGYVFQTSPGWVTWARGSPNRLKDGIQPLDGVVETSWLPFSFTMNWRFTRPGKVRFEAGEPFCFITLLPAVAIEGVTPTRRTLADDPKLHREYVEWHRGRHLFNEALGRGEPEAVAQRWLKHYLNGASPTGAYVADGDHRVRRRLNPPTDG